MRAILHDPPLDARSAKPQIVNCLGVPAVFVKLSDLAIRTSGRRWQVDGFVVTQGPGFSTCITLHRALETRARSYVDFVALIIPVSRSIDRGQLRNRKIDCSEPLRVLTLNRVHTYDGVIRVSVMMTCQNLTGHTAGRSYWRLVPGLRSLRHCR